MQGTTIARRLLPRIQIGPSALPGSDRRQPRRCQVMGTASPGAVLGVELEQSLQRGESVQISQRIGSAANPADRADGSRKQRGSRTLIGISVVW